MIHVGQKVSRRIILAALVLNLVALIGPVEANAFARGVESTASNSSDDLPLPETTAPTNAASHKVGCTVPGGGPSTLKRVPFVQTKLAGSASTSIFDKEHTTARFSPSQGRAKSEKNDAAFVDSLTRKSDTIYVGTTINVRFFERTDLSGRFRVRNDGSVSIPLLGAFFAVGCDEAGLEQKIAASYARLVGRNSSVSVEVVEHKPIYVTGELNKPGAYPYQWGMTVMHGVSVAGGFFRGTALIADTMLQATREEGQARISSYEIGRLLAQLSRLTAERDGLTNADPSSDLENSVGHEAARALMVPQNEILQRRLQLNARKLDGFRRSQELTRSEIDSLREQIGSIDAQLELYARQLGKMRELAGKGLARSVTVMELETAAARLDAEKRAVSATIARAEKERAKVLEEAASFEPDRQLKIANEILALEKKLRGQRERLRSSLKISGLWTDSFGRPIQPEYHYTIIRQNDNGNLEVTADQATSLQPGDVLSVTLRSKSPDSAAPLAADAKQPKPVHERRTSFPASQ